MNSPVCPMCGSSMTVRPTAHGDVLDCDNENYECSYQEDILKGEIDGIKKYLPAN